MDATDGTQAPAEPRPAIMQSTEVQPPAGDTTGRRHVIVHAPGIPVPERAPACLPGCQLCTEHPR